MYTNQLILENYERIKIKVELRSDLTASAKVQIENRIRLALGGCEILWDIADDLSENASSTRLCQIFGVEISGRRSRYSTL